MRVRVNYVTRVMADSSTYKLLPEAVAMYTQTDPLKGSKDLSKNFVSGDFEYREDATAKCRRRQICRTVTVVVVGLVLAGLVALSVLREVQLGRLRRDLDDVSADVLAIKVTLKSLNQKLLNRKIIGFKDLDDTVRFLF